MAGHFSILHDSWAYTLQWLDTEGDAFRSFQQFLIREAMPLAGRGISFLSGALLLPYRFEHQEGIVDSPFHVQPMPPTTSEERAAATNADLYLPNRCEFRCDYRDKLEAPVTLLNSLYGYLTRHAREFWPHMLPEGEDPFVFLGEEGLFEMLIETDGNARDYRTRLYLLSIGREGVLCRRLSRGPARVIRPRLREGPSPFSREGLYIASVDNPEGLSFSDEVLADGTVRKRREEAPHADPTP